MAIELSVVVPVYNAAKYLYQNVETLLKQDVSDELYEIILIDDGSKDESLRICLDIAKMHANVKVIHKENGGVSSARNKGLDSAVGKYISFCDSDDYVNHDYIKTILNTVDDNEFYLWNNFIEQEEKIEVEKQWFQHLIPEQVERQDILEWICDQRLNAPWDKVYLRSTIEENRIRFVEGLNMGEDLLFNLHYAACMTKYKVVDKCVYYHTVNLDGLCHRKTTFMQWKEFEVIYEHLLQLISAYKLDGELVRIVNLAFLRNIANYAGKLCCSGFSVKEIREHFTISKMRKQIIRVKTRSLKDFIRKTLLKFHLYRLCTLL